MRVTVTLTNEQIEMLIDAAEFRLAGDTSDLSIEEVDDLQAAFNRLKVALAKARKAAANDKDDL